MFADRPDPNQELTRFFEPLRVLFAVLALLLGFASAAHAGTPRSGEIRVLADGGMQHVASLATDVRFDVHGLVAEVHVVQRFHNEGATWLEAEYVLPLPEGAAVHDLTLHVGARTIVGEIREKQQAREEYAAAASRGQRASLVEAMSGNLFRTALANVAPGEDVEVEIGYWQRIDYQDGAFALSFPLTFTPRYTQPAAPAATAAPDTASAGTASADTASPDAANPAAPATPAPRVTLQVELDPGLPLATVESPSHAVHVEPRAGRYTIRLATTDIPADRDFVLRWVPKPLAAPAAALFSEHTADADYALLMLVPPTLPATPLPRELILVIDTSGSMEGGSLIQAKAALDLALGRLTPRDRFNVIRFSSDTTQLFDQAAPADPQDVQLAREWVAQLKAEGGTEMAPALHAALAGTAPDGYVRQVVFATDGAVDNAEALYTLIETELGTSRLFPVGIGSAPNAHFLAKAAQRGRGAEIVVRDLGEVGARMQTLFDKLDHPTLRDLQLRWPVAAETYPQRLPDLYHGEPLIAVARLERAGGAIEALGTLAERPWSQTLRFDARAGASGLARLWARQKIDELEDAIDRGADETTTRQAILDLALAQHLVSRYTSLVAVDRTPARPAESDLHHTDVANAAPNGSLAFAGTATDARLKLAIGAFALLLALGLMRTRPGRPASARH